MAPSVGSGVRVSTPVGLTLALDYGINVTRHNFAQEDFGALQFAIGLF